MNGIGLIIGLVVAMVIYLIYGVSRIGEKPWANKLSSLSPNYIYGELDIYGELGEGMESIKVHIDFGGGVTRYYHVARCGIEPAEHYHIEFCDPSHGEILHVKNLICYCKDVK